MIPTVVPASITKAADPIACAMQGCLFSGHVLLDHIMEVHKLSAPQYSAVTNNAPLHSDEGKEEFERKIAALATQSSRRTPARKVADVDRKKKKYDITDTFGIDLGFELSDKLDAKGNPIPLTDANGKKVPKRREVEGYEERTEHVPAIDPGYVFPVDETKVMLLGLAARDNILLVGDTGTGKTSLVEQIAARLNYQVMKVSFDGHITRQDLVGEWVVKGKEMEFQYGVLVLGFKMPGTIIILDEWDTISGECAFVLQRPLQRDDRKILLMETGGELVPLHPDNIICATANTAGQGDDTGLYSQGTKVQNYAQLNRFSMTIRTKYLSEADETNILHKKFPELEKSECQALVQAINAVRQGYDAGQISAPLSTRDLINWAEKFIRMGDPERAARYCFINRMPPEDAKVTEGIIQRVFQQQA